MEIKTRSQLFQEYRTILSNPEESTIKGSYNDYCEIANTKWVRVNDVVDYIGFIRSMIHSSSYDLCSECRAESDYQDVVGLDDVEDKLDRFVVELLKNKSEE